MINSSELATRFLVSRNTMQKIMSKLRREGLILLRWHREQLKALIPPLLEKWQSVLGVQIAAWGIKRMKTKWGSCNPACRRIWFNLELANTPTQCLEYIVVHELVHLLERQHNERFTALIEAHVPQWRQCRERLNKTPLRFEEWEGLLAPR